MKTNLKQYDKSATEALPMVIPIQSMSFLMRDHTFSFLSCTFGNPNRAIAKTALLMMAEIWNAQRHPIVSANTPPSTRPTLNPIGWPPPIEANAMFLLLPCGKVLVMMLTADGKQKEMAIPAKPRKTINCVLVFAKPQASVKPDWRKQPIRYIGLEPTTSATEPSRSSVQPHVRA